MSQISHTKLFNELLYESEKTRGDMVYLRQPIAGVWHDFTWKQAMHQARIMTTFLKKLGLKRGDRVGILSKNCAEWFICDFAIAMGGFVSVPLFPSQAPPTNRYILEHSESKVIFVGKLDDPLAQEQGIPDSVTRIGLPYEGGMSAAYQWNDIIRDYQCDHDNYVPKPDDLYTIAYTSGTTGSPKGAVITHGVLGNRLKRAEETFFADIEYVQVLSYLPLAHVYERVVVEGASITKKCTVSFVESLSTFARDLKQTSPNIFFSVPRLWMQFQKGVLEKIPQKKLNVLLKLPIVRTIVKKRIRESLGFGRCDLFFSGSAPISQSLLAWYEKIGIIILEGYGRTEDLAYISFSAPDKRKVGTVGKFGLGVEYRIGENNELLTRSDTMMTGYYKDEAATKEAFTADGFLRTGDEVSIDKDGFLTILGRVKDTFKTDKGEFVNPVPIESEFAHNHDIEQLCLIGLNLPQPVMLAVLSATGKLLPKDDIIRGLNDSLNAANIHLSKWEKIAGVIVCKENWTSENGFLTPTLKMKRNAIHKHYVELAKTIDFKVSLVHFED